VTRWTPEDIYAACIAAGFTASAATTMTAVSQAEDDTGDDTRIGDVALEDGYWGPSVGVFQVRTVKSQTGTGQDRDVSALTGDLLAQARAAYDISGGGEDFTPWTTYTAGKYQLFLGTAQAAAGKLGSLTVDAAKDMIGAAGSTIAGTLKSLVEPVVGNVRNLTFEGLAVVLGLALVGMGVYVVAAGKVRQRVGEVLQ
jgi:hypothetical protein